MLYPAELPGLSIIARGGQNPYGQGEAAARHALSMNFRFAHRCSASVSSRQAALRRLRGARGPRSRLPCLAACGRPAGRVQAVSVDERLDIELGDGRTVRLGGLDAPNARPRRARNREGRARFPERAAARPGRGPYPVGRRNRSLGQDGRRPRPCPARSRESTAAALLAAGYARVRPEFETRGCAAERLMIEEGARQAGLGIWRDPAFRRDPIVQLWPSSAAGPADLW